MNSDPLKNPRRSIRLKDYDYTQPGAYFVTLVTIGRACMLGEVKGDCVVLSNLGLMVSALWQALPNHFSITLGEWVVMPNHLHGIIIIEEGEGTISVMPVFTAPGNKSNPPGRPNGTVSGSLGAIIQNFKSITTRRANGIWGTSGKPLWQRNYFEHIIRDEKDWDAVYRYIVSNPIHWEEDENR